MRRNDAVTLDEVEALAPSHIIISPGPCTPAEAGISTDVVRRFGPTIADSRRVPRPSVHRRGVRRRHRARRPAGARQDLAGRARRLERLRRAAVAAAGRALPLARHRARVAAAVAARHRVGATTTARSWRWSIATHPVVGVQFHPESAATEYGYAMLDRFLHGDRARGRRAADRRRRRATAVHACRHAAAVGAPDDERDGTFVPPPVELVAVDVVIVETIVTTVAADGAVNCAPMGVEWGDETIVLKPFLETATYRNVVATRAAVVNLTDDVRVFARAAISNPQYPTGARHRRPRRACWPTAARGASSRCGRSTARRRARASRRRWCIAACAASSSASIARGMPCSRRPSTPRGCTCCRARSSTARWRGCR